jgi:DNA replicative helicase MCM subunit Mcm2 (Cdc46/Mcm family)
MAEIKMPHPAHEGHLCFLQNVGYLITNLQEYKKLVKEGRYVCKNCGRVAANEQNLCAPEKL